MSLSAFLVLLAGMTAPAPAAGAQAQPDTVQRPAWAPVVLRRDTLFHVGTRLGPYSAAERARAVSERLARIADDPLMSPDSVRVIHEEGAASVFAGDIIITTITMADAAAAGIPLDSLAAQRARAIAQALEQWSLWAVIRTILIGLALALATTLVLLLAIRLLGRLFPAIYSRLNAWRGTRIPAIRIQRLVLLSASRLTDVLLAGARITRVVMVALLLIWYVPLVLSFFPWTERYADRVFEWILAPIREIWANIVAYLPNLFYIAAIVAVTYYALRFIRLFFEGIEHGTLVFPNFYPEWAIPTFKIVRFLVLAFALIVLFPYLPGSGSDAFKGVSVFLGVLLSFGSAGAIGNVVAGVVITYMRPFELGDRVKIADTVGDVIQRTLLVTRVRTPKHVEVSVPNALVLSSHIVNYSAAAKEGGVILHTGVTIGYDTPWQQVHELLLAAAERTDGLLEDPKPFVLQTALSDFYVAYEINAYTEDPSRMATIYSDLHRHIQDVFREAGVQIMSPHYVMDPPTLKVPPAGGSRRAAPPTGN